APVREDIVAEMEHTQAVETSERRCSGQGWLVVDDDGLGVRRDGVEGRSVQALRHGTAADEATAGSVEAPLRVGEPLLPSAGRLVPDHRACRVVVVAPTRS